MSNNRFIQSRAPRIWNGRFSSTIPVGWAFILDTDGITFITDEAGNRLIAPIG